MKLSTRVRYGLRALVELADIQRNAPVLLDVVAKRQDISRKYLDSIFSALKAAGLVTSSRGAGGGFLLARTPKEVTVADVYRAIEGDISLVDCSQGGEKCRAQEDCATTLLWTRLSRLLAIEMEKVTVEQLLVEKRKRKEGRSAMYYI